MPRSPASARTSATSRARTLTPGRRTFLVRTPARQPLFRCMPDTRSERGWRSVLDSAEGECGGETLRPYSEAVLPRRWVVRHRARERLERPAVVLDESGETQACSKDCHDDLAEAVVPLDRTWRADQLIAGVGDLVVPLHALRLLPVRQLERDRDVARAADPGLLSAVRMVVGDGHGQRRVQHRMHVADEEAAAGS